jgi:hypothetical protein
MSCARLGNRHPGGPRDRELVRTTNQLRLITGAPGEPVAPTAAGRHVADAAVDLLAAAADFANSCRSLGSGTITLKAIAVGVRRGLCQGMVPVSVVQSHSGPASAFHHPLQRDIPDPRRFRLIRGEGAVAW